MARKKKQNKMSAWSMFNVFLLALAIILTLLQFVSKKFFGVDLGITFFGMEMF